MRPALLAFHLFRFHHRVLLPACPPPSACYCLQIAETLLHPLAVCYSSRAAAAVLLTVGAISAAPHRRDGATPLRLAVTLTDAAQVERVPASAGVAGWSYCHDCSDDCGLQLQQRTASLATPCLAAWATAAATTTTTATAAPVTAILDGARGPGAAAAIHRRHPRRQAPGPGKAADQVLQQPSQEAMMATGMGVWGWDGQQCGMPLAWQLGGMPLEAAGPWEP